ncbi:hypothetical protein C2E23DRAFT_268639 [Lenzites betulinus]|nr:hypothetical protein C2E23DRAFT_268639 [Lenzites betulinus]
MATMTAPSTLTSRYSSLHAFKSCHPCQRNIGRDPILPRRHALRVDGDRSWYHKRNATLSNPHGTPFFPLPLEDYLLVLSELKDFEALTPHWKELRQHTACWHAVSRENIEDGLSAPIEDIRYLIQPQS